MATIDSLSHMARRAAAEPIAGLLNTIMAAQAAGRDVISLAAGLPDEEMLPADKMGKLFELARAKYPGLLNYTRPQGWPPLNTAFAHMLRSQGVKCSTQDILITSGGMEALSLAAQLTLNEGDTVLTEGPAFPGAISTFGLLGANVIHVPCDENGMKPEALRDMIERHHPKLVSLMPDYQNPSGALMSLERRQQIAQILLMTHTYGVEDGAYAPLRFDEEAMPPLQSFAPDKIMYVSSVSKILAPAMRIGCLVAPSGVIAEKAGGIKATYNMQASAMNEAITERFISPEHTFLADNLAALRSTYAQRRDVMITALGEHFPSDTGFSWSRPRGGMFLWLCGPESADLTTLFDLALEKGVAYVPGSMFFTSSNQARNCARINFASTPEGNIREAIRRLSSALLTHL